MQIFFLKCTKKSHSSCIYQKKVVPLQRKKMNNYDSLGTIECPSGIDA